MKTKCCRDINDLIYQMKRQNKIYLIVNKKFYEFTKNNILNTPLIDLLNMLDNGKIYVENKTEFL